MKNSVFCLFLLIIYMNKYVDCFFGVSYSDAKDMFETFTNIVNRVNQAQTQAETGYKGTQYDANPWGDQTSAVLDALINKVDAISTKITIMEDRMNSRFGKIEKMITEVTYKTQKDNLLRDFNKASNRIQFAYEKLLTFANVGKNITKRRIENFIEQNIKNQGTEGVEGNLATIFDIITSENLINVGSSEQSLLALITKKELENSIDVCDRYKSPQLIIYQFFLTVCSMELLGTTTLAYGYALNEILQKSKNKTDLASDEIPFIRQQFKKRVTAYSDKFAESIKSVSRAFRNCDPVESHMHIRDVTFTEMWGLTQSIVLSEFSLASRRSCAGTCANVHNKPNNHQFCYNKPMHGDRVYKTDTRACWWWYNAPEKPELCPTPRRCHGLMSDCIEITNAQPCMMKNNTRRYQFIKDVYYDKSYGLESECKGYEAYFEWSRDNVYDCTFCLCTCDDNIYTSESVHMISLKLARSDTANNKVVVGVRFKLYEKILHIQIKENEILDRHRINNNKNINWVELPKMRKDILRTRERVMNPKVIEGRDFIVWDRFEYAFNFDELSLPPERVVTGVKFGYELTSHSKYKHRVQIQIESMEYNSETGELIQGTEKMMKPDPENHDKQLVMKYLKIPQNAVTETVLDSSENGYGILVHSELEEDAGQTVLPLFDAQPVEVQPHAPLGGIGFHHRGTKFEAGFYGLTGHTVDYSAILKAGS